MTRQTFLMPSQLQPPHLSPEQNLVVNESNETKMCYSYQIFVFIVCVFVDVFFFKYMLEII